MNAKVYSLKISNYRGIQRFERFFGFNNFVCIAGNSGSGKTTILNAIYKLLSMKAEFKVSDFYKEDTGHSIEIEVVLYDLPDEITQRGNHSPVITLKLIVKEDLKPHWTVIKGGKSIELSNEDKKHYKVNFLIPTSVHLEASKCSAGILLIDDAETYFKSDEIEDTLKSTQTRGQVIITTKSKNILERIKKENIYKV